MASTAAAVTASARKTGRSVLSIAVEMLALRFSQGRLGFSEYLDYELAGTDLTLEQKKAFGGWRAQAILEKLLVDEYSEILSLDKISMYAMFAGCGFPHPALRATYRTKRPAKLAQNLESPSELLAFLRQPENVPVYVKPSSSSFGRGNFLLTGIQDKHFELGSAERLNEDQLLDRLEDRRGLGWVLQEPLTSHPRLADVCGTAKISGFRIHSFYSDRGPIITRAIWRANAGNRDDDHFKFGTSGNLICQIDLESGKVLRVVGGFRDTRRLHESHPNTGRPMLGIQIPCWREIRQLVLDAHLAFPGYTCPGWDIALCADGPKIIEVNGFGDIDTSQHSDRRGFLDPQFIEMLDRRGVLERFLRGSFVRDLFARDRVKPAHRAQWAW
ncbi:MAG: hypothetical protein JNM98_07520 [Rhodocyclaceae bacterium]|nr:hypothetical protein [Rhodocyclaceae bacterium]